MSRQAVADGLQISGAAGVTVAAGMVSPALGLFVGSLLAIIAGVVVAR
jgi:hypothetical protein